MSENTNAPQQPTTTPEAEKPKRAAKAKPMTVAEVAATIAKAKKTDPKVEQKKLRGHIRANFDTLAKSWPELKKVGKENRDGNRYPAIPGKLAKELIVRRTKAAK